MTEEIPFPNGYIDGSIEHKLFKHVLFKTDKKLTDFRVKAIGHDWTELHEVQHSQLSIPLEAWDLTKDKVRIKAVLSAPDHGVLESDWVSQQVLGVIQKRKLNQFRVRGVSDTNIRSRWIYSELKDEDDELVVFQLLHDILDMMTVVHEHDLTALIETELMDKLINFLTGKQTDEVDFINTMEFEDKTFKYQLIESVRSEGVGSHLFNLFKRFNLSEHIYNEFMTSMAHHEENKKAKLQETISLFMPKFKKNLIEQKKFSNHDITDHAKLWKMKEDHVTEILDHMLNHIFMISVEDSYDKAISEASLVALLNGDEEILSLLNDSYEFEASSVMKDLFIESTFIESFVSYFSDGLKLFIESNFDDLAVAKIREEAVPVLLLMYKEVFIPLQKLDGAVVDLFNNLDDDAKELHDNLKTSFSGLQFEYFDEKSNVSWREIEQYLTEMFEYLLITDHEVEKDIFTNVFSTVIGSMKKDALKALIIYDPVEAIEFISRLVENVRLNYSSLRNVAYEESYLHLRENLLSQESVINMEQIEAQKLKKQEDLVFSKTPANNALEIKKLLQREDYTLDLDKFNAIVENYTTLLSEGYQLQEILSNKTLFNNYNLKIVENIRENVTMTDTQLEISAFVAMMHSLVVENKTKCYDESYDVAAYINSHLELLYKHRLFEKFTGPFMIHRRPQDYEVANMFPIFYRYDDYFNIMWNIRENVHVHLGELDLTGGRFPVGYFVLGDNNLEGETP